MEPAPSAETVARLLSHRAWLQALARRIAGEGESDDLVQDTWVAALEDPPGRPDALRPWIAGVVRHLASGLRRARARRGERERRAARPEALPSTIELVERVDTEQRLARALLALDEPYRTTLLLRFHEGLSAAEIARRQCVPEGTVRWRCKAGLDELRGRLAREFGGREALGLVLADVIHGSSSGRIPSGTGAAAAAGAGAMIGAKGIWTGAVLVLGLAAWMAIEEFADPPERVDRTADADRVAGAQAPPAGATFSESSELIEPDSSDHDGPIRRSPAGPPVTRLRVLESDGRPNAGLSVVVEPESGEARAVSATIDADGWVAFPASGEPRRIAVERLEAFPFRTELAFTPGETTIELPEPWGDPLAGVVLVEGQPPPRPLWLVLYAASSAHLTVDTGDVSSLLAGDVTYAATDAEGHFRFRGLARGGLNLRAPEGYARRGTRAHSDPGQGPIFHFEAPAEGLRIELDRHASVHGRVLEADGATPVPRASVEIEIAHGLYGRETEPDGTFEIFAREPPASVRVKLGRRPVRAHELHGADPEGTTLEFRFPEPRHDTDLGDLLLRPSSGFLLQVRNAEQRPLAGAEVGVCTERPTHATDVTGRTWLGGLGPGTELAITMRGYRTSLVTLPDPIPETLRVDLIPTNDLTLEVRGPNGEPQAWILLQISASEWFFPREEPGSLAWQQDRRAWGGAGSWWGSWKRHGDFEGRRGSIWGGPQARVQFSTDQDGRCSMGELHPGIAFHLSVLDDLGTVLHERELAPLDVEERRVVPVQLAIAPARLSGRVVTERGEPVAEAGVSLDPLGVEDSHSRGTGSDGRFRFRYVAEHDLRLTVTKRGFLPRVLERVRPSTEEIEIVLARGYDVIVRVLDSAEHALAGGKARARPLGKEPWLSADEHEDGVFEVAGLAGVPHEIELELGAGVLRETWTPPQPEVVFRVLVGTLDLAWNLAPDPRAAGYHVRLEPAGGGLPGEKHLDVAPRGFMRFQQFAGDYDLVLVAERPAPGGGRWNDDVERRALTVVAGETVRVELGP